MKRSAALTERIDDLLHEVGLDRLSIALLLDELEHGRRELVLALDVLVEVVLPLDESELKFGAES